MSGVCPWLREDGCRTDGRAPEQGGGRCLRLPAGPGDLCLEAGGWEEPGIRTSWSPSERAPSWGRNGRPGLNLGAEFRQAEKEKEKLQPPSSTRLPQETFLPSVPSATPAGSPDVVVSWVIKMLQKLRVSGFS